MNRSSVLANPVLVGAVTVLVTLVAVFLAYNANNGLPFVPTTALKAQVPDGANLVPGNEVRSGGYRVGVIEDMAPVRMRDGTVGAELSLKLDKKAGDVPRDSKVVIRARSALGLKYLDLQLGSAKQEFEDGDTIPVEQTGASTDLDRVLSMFDEETRAGAQRTLHGFGDALSGRGESLGRTIEVLPELFGSLEPVMANLAHDDTELRNFFSELGETAAVVAPVSKTHARLFTTMADTFAAIGADEEALKSMIEKSPSTLEVSTDSLRVQRPFLTHLAEFSEEFKPATRELRAALPTINRAIDRGIGVQRRAVPMSEQLAETLGALRELSEAPQSKGGIRAATDTVNTLNPQLRYYGPFQTVCNYWNYWWYHVSEHISEPDFTGLSERAMINSAGRQDDSLGSMGANGPANGEHVEEGNAQHFHGPLYGVAVTDTGEADCEAGQRGYLERQARYAPSQYRIHADPRSPGAQGPTFTGRPRVPEGQTFTRLPETGAFSTVPPPEFGER